jgi:lipoate-protein ligase A
LGAVFATRVVRSGFEELYDYDVLRALVDPTMFVVHLQVPTLVLGGSQSSEVLDPSRTGSMPLRRRRGGGGLVLLQPDDLWIDWWIPASDPRWSADIRVSSVRAGGWWRQALDDVVQGELSVHDGPVEGDPLHRIVCFAGRGPGEVFVDGRKAVGLTQWRVREGIFISTVVHAKPSHEIIDLLAHEPAGLRGALDHHVIASLGIDDPEAIVDTLVEASGPWLLRRLFLSA